MPPKVKSKSKGKAKSKAKASEPKFEADVVKGLRAMLKDVKKLRAALGKVQEFEIQLMRWIMLAEME